VICAYRWPRRKHCRFVVEGESLRLEDLGSSNGTYVNGKRIQEAIIKPGDNVQIGPLTFVVQIDGQPPDEEIPEPVAFDLADSGVAAAAGKAAAGDSAFDLDLDFLEEEPKKQTQE
jgi:predicted component of type VI protein secretion system